MKKFLLIIVLFMCFNLTACKKDNEEEKEPGVPSVVDDSEKVDIRSKVSVQEIGVIVGEYSNRFTVARVNNNNDRAIYVDVKISYYDNKGQLTDTRNVYVRVGAHRSAYAVDRMFAEDVSFSSYKFDFDVSLETLEDYESIYDGIKVTYVDTGKGVDVNFANNGKRTTTATAYIFFRKDGKIVSVNEVKEFNITPGSKKTQKITYPYKTYSTLIPFDRIELILNEVSTEL